MPNESRYRVAWSRQAREQLKKLGGAAQGSERKKQLASNVRLIDQCLREDALSFGEIYRRRGAVEERRPRSIEHSGRQSAANMTDAESSLALLQEERVYPVLRARLGARGLQSIVPATA